MDGESVPDLRHHFRTKDIRQRFAAVDVQVVQHQMDGFRFRVCQCQADRYLSELEAGTVRRGEGEVLTGLWFYGAEDIGCPAAFVFVIPARFPPWCCRRGWSHIGVQGNRLLIQADYRWFPVVGPLV